MSVLRIRQPTGNFLKSAWTSVIKDSLRSVGTSSIDENAALPEQAPQESPIKSVPKHSRPANTSNYQGFRFVYPEFLPDPNVKFRNQLREKLERIDMLKRRQVIDIPEFYVGSILSVQYSDPHSQGKLSKFVGICIDRESCGLRAQFVLRNCIDHQGVEMRFECYDPTINKIQVLRLEKRLDSQLYYLRDADEKYSTFDINMEPEYLPEGAEIPINTMQIELKPKPWYARWERKHLKGVIGIEKHMSKRMRLKQFIEDTPWEKYDLVKEYRKTIPEEEQNSVWADVYTQLHQLELSRKRASRKRSFLMPKKTG